VNTVLVTGAGGPSAENVVQSLRACDCRILGVDMDQHMLALSSADVKAKVHHASEATDMYINDLNTLYKQHECTMLLPVTDREVFVTAVNQYRLPKLPMPNWRFIAACREKDGLYKFMSENGFKIPQTVYEPNGYRLKHPMWIRASLGAGGYLASAVYTQEELDAYFRFYKDKHKPMMSQLLKGRNYSWTALYVNGQLELSVAKERLEWVYNRIGTTAVQQSVHDVRVSGLCMSLVSALMEKYDSAMTGLVMIDLLEDYPGGQLYVTEVNAGRAGTVNLWFTLASDRIFGDNQANFHAQLLRAHLGESLLPHERVDSLPEGIKYVRHIDMGALLTYQGMEWRFSPWDGNVILLV
jgi:hypothetical protein